jgi:vacuolar-type H+-ATPase subunit C/Vma6
MPGMGERAYVYAKACGIIGKSFIGKRTSRLHSVTRLTELDRLVFPGDSRDLPGQELLVDLERRIIGRSVNQIITIVDSFSKPPELLSRLVRTYEYEDVKRIISALGAGDARIPAYTDIGRFRTVRFEAYPDPEGMFKGTEFEFMKNEKFEQGDRTAEGSRLQTKLDHQYYISLWESLSKLPRKDKSAYEKLFCEEISLRNAVWALRLRTYYNMPDEEIRERLVDISPRSRGNRASLAADALAALSLALDNRGDWLKWRRSGFLNPEQPGTAWKLDPRYFQNAAAAYLYRLARLSFRRNPFSLDTVLCFIKLKQFEEDFLTSMAEGLGMGMSVQDVSTLLEVEA